MQTEVHFDMNTQGFLLSFFIYFECTQRERTGSGCNNTPLQEAYFSKTSFTVIPVLKLRSCGWKWTCYTCQKFQLRDGRKGIWYTCHKFQEGRFQAAQVRGKTRRDAVITRSVSVLRAPQGGNRLPHIPAAVQWLTVIAWCKFRRWVGSQLLRVRGVVTFLRPYLRPAKTALLHNTY